MPQNFPAAEAGPTPSEDRDGPVPAAAEATAFGVEQLRALLDALPHAVLAVGSRYSILFANRAAERLLGYGRGELHSMPLAALSDVAAMQLSGLARRDSPRQILCRMIRKPGDSVQIRIEGRPFHPGAQEALLLLHDGREQRQPVEPPPGSSQLATLGQIATGLAQELDQPVGVIRMAADNTLLMLEDGETDPRFLRGQLGLISGQSQRMARIVDHIRVFARIERIDPVAFDVGESAATALSLVERDFRRCGLRTLLEVQADCPKAFGLPLRLEQVLVNLLTNARDAILQEPEPPAASAAGGFGQIGEVRLAVDAVSGHGSGEGTLVAIRLSDTGPGIPETHLGRIFDPFFTTKAPGRGTGLGLTICAALVADMGGSIAARNGDAGAEFVILMPAAQLTADRRRPPPPSPAPAPAAGDAGNGSPI